MPGSSSCIFGKEEITKESVGSLQYRTSRSLTFPKAVGIVTDNCSQKGLFHEKKIMLKDDQIFKTDCY